MNLKSACYLKIGLWSKITYCPLGFKVGTFKFYVVFFMLSPLEQYSTVPPAFIYFLGESYYTLLLPVGGNPPLLVFTMLTA